MERFNQMLDTRWLSNGGPFVREFEQRIADMVGRQALRGDVQRDASRWRS